MKVAVHLPPTPPEGWAEYRKTRRFYLMRRKFPLPPGLVFNGNIPEDHKEFDAYRAGRSPKEKREYEHENERLKALSNGALNREYEAEQAQERHEQHQAEMREVYRLYVDLTRWDFSACVALLLERDPDAVNRASESDTSKRRLIKSLVASIGAGELKTVELKRPTTVHLDPADYTIKPRELLKWAATKPSVPVPLALLAEFEKRFPVATPHSLKPGRSPTRVSQPAVAEWYTSRWNDRVKEGMSAPSRAEDHAALKTEFGDKATRAMLDIERAKHPELRKPGRGRKFVA